MNFHPQRRRAERPAPSPASASSEQTQPPPRSRKGQRLGYLVTNGQTSPIPCVVRALEDGSATLVIAGWLGIPDRFSLQVEPDQIRLECTIAERRGNAVTVRFD